MQFTKIDINNWTRKEYFDHYFDNTPCTYSMTVKLDISKLKKDGKKLYPTLLYGVTTILNRHEEFRTALDKNGQVGVFSEMLPCYTIFHKETETFSSIWTEFTADYTEFLQNYQKDIDAYGERKGMFAKPNPPENTFPVSMIPWTSPGKLPASLPSRCRVFTISLPKIMVKAFFKLIYISPIKIKSYKIIIDHNAHNVKHFRTLQTKKHRTKTIDAPCAVLASI